MNKLIYDNENQYHYNDEYIFFTKSFLSQWYGAFAGQYASFKIEIFEDVTVYFNCAEQAMMWAKAMMFCDYTTAQKILGELHPNEQRKLGRTVKNFNPETWDKLKFNIIVSINRSKFYANPTLSRKLLETENRHLVEAAPWDKVWGIGMGVDDPFILDETKWKGENLLGKALMEVRQNIAEISYGVFA